MGAAGGVGAADEETTLSGLADGDFLFLGGDFAIVPETNKPAASTSRITALSWAGRAFL
jgi:hypothetical protein